MKTEALSPSTTDRSLASFVQRAQRAFQEHRALIDTLEASGLPSVVIAPGSSHMPIIYANPAFVEWSGVPAADALGKSALFMASAGSDGAEPSRMVSAIREQRNMVIEATLERSDGRSVPASLTINFFQLGKDRKAYPCLSFYDGGNHFINAEALEPRENVEARLKESDARLRALAEASSEVLYRMSPDWGTMRELTGGGFLAPTRGPSRAWLMDYIPQDDQPRVMAAIDQAIANRDAFELEHPVRRADGNIGWTFSRAVPILDADGRITEWFGTASDITDRKFAENQLRTSEARLRHFGEASSDVLWIRNAATMQWEYLTPAFETIYGIPTSEALSGNNYRSWLELVVPEDRARTSDALRRVRQGEHVTFEYRVRNAIDGKVRWLRNNDFPMFDDEGNVEFIGGIGEDITEAQHSRELLELSEDRLRSAAEVARLGLWDWNIKTGAVVWSDEHFRMEGYGVDEVEPSYDAWAARIHPEDRAGAEAALHEALQSRTQFDHEFRSVHPDGSVHWLHGRGTFTYDCDGQPIRMVGAMIETTSWREMEERQQVLVAELQHRTRNLIAVVRSIAGETASASQSLVQFKEAFDERLSSLSRVQGLLSRAESEPITIGALVDLEMRALGSASDRRVHIDGPPVTLRNATVQTIALALHELATNARKYGALSGNTGTLKITWRIQCEKEARWLHFVWEEQGIADQSVPANKSSGGGFGRRLIEQSLSYSLGAKINFELRAETLRCSMDIPLDRK